MDLRKVDLNLLGVFECIYRVRNLTQVAHEISLTQPAVSHALGRLRATMNDPLFIRTASGLEPTLRSDELIGPIRAALGIIEECLASSSTFDPLKTRREFRLLLSDVGELIFIPKLLQFFREHAPNATITALQASRTNYEAMLRAREADITVGHLPMLEKLLRNARLFEDRWVVLRGARFYPGNPPLTADDFERFPHVVVNPPGSGAEKVLQAEVTRRSVAPSVVLTLPHFFALPNVILNSDLIATVPSSVASSIHSAEDIQVHELPFPSPKLDVRIFWHSRQDGDAGHQWLRDVFGKLFGRAR
ncbi:LysR family transcriptional regulator [Cupriavidus lacunae]|nr:LysR family transcriptional regulator [Cupriavidus lacunae]